MLFRRTAKIPFPIIPCVMNRIGLVALKFLSPGAAYHSSWSLYTISSRNVSSGRILFFFSRPKNQTIGRFKTRIIRYARKLLAHMRSNAREQDLIRGGILRRPTRCERQNRPNHFPTAHAGSLHDGGLPLSGRC